MKKELKKTRYSVLAHSFATFDEARDYVQQLVDGGECKVLTKVQQWLGRCKGWHWLPYIDDNGKLCFS